MNVLVVNDDGILSEGIKALADFLSEEHNVIVVAPDGNRSAFSHSLSIYKDTIFKEIDFSDKYRTFITSGTPADCVKFAVHKFSDIKFDLICSGINKGHNLGSDTVYSGTISACLEGNFFKIKGIALSNYLHKIFTLNQSRKFRLKNQNGSETCACLDTSMIKIHLCSFLGAILLHHSESCKAN